MRRAVPRAVTAFLTVGAAAFVVQVGVLNALLHLGAGPLTANGGALICSTGVAFAGNRHWVFRGQSSRCLRVEAAAFCLVNLVTFGLSEAVVATSYLFGAEHDHTAVNVLNVLGVALGSVVRYLAYRHYVFGASPRAACPPGAVPLVTTGSAPAGVPESDEAAPAPTAA